ncbi:hypothetical protein [Rhodoferax sp.]|uniref:hypothetical protein n=1 Tax=Rhodoferax sp. TaxID=50421 RepID=UPI002768C2B1|nr:hypothetical protein [Rhodoferax sp.]
MRTFIIRPTSDLALLRRGSERRFYGRIEIDAAVLESDGGEALAVVVGGLNRHLNACGCGLASVFVVMTMAGLAMFHGTAWRESPGLSWQTGAMVFITLCAAAALGKLIGIAHSEWVFRRLLKRLAVTLRTTEPLLRASPH